MDRLAPMRASFSQTIFDAARISSPVLAIDTTNQDRNNVHYIHSVTRNPLQIWIVQVGVIMITTQMLSLLLKKIRQPRVIAEILGGILLSPPVLGRIPGFTEAIFPSTSMPFLSLVANIGILLFMFLIGLDIDGSVVRRNARLSASIAFSGMIIPFALGTAFSVPLHKEFIDSDTKSTHFLLFVGVAFSITALPVLCRILTELQLLNTTVGVVALSAGVANDVVGWTLLAFSIALTSAISGLTALWVLLGGLGWTVLLLFPGRNMLSWLARRTGSIETGPTMVFMMTSMFMVFCSAFMTDMIGIHAIFGSFLVGLIIPREGGLAIALTEKLHDMVSIIFLPLYFTMSGLSTDLSLLNNGITWAYTIGLISVSWAGKFGSCTVAARISGFRWREAMSIGTLMSCKGLVELIILNVGLEAGILNTRIYSMFILEALFLTFLTTPVVVALYPPKYHKRTAIAGTETNGVIDGEDTPKDAIGQYRSISRLTIILDKLEHLPVIITMTQLFRPFVLELSQHDPTLSDHSDSGLEQGRTIPPTLTTPSATIQALRVIELSEPINAITKSSIADSLIHTDPLSNLFKTFCNMSKIPVSPSLLVASFHKLSTTVIEHARENLSDIVLIPWLPFQVPTTYSPNPHTPEDHLSSNAQIGGTRSTIPIEALLNSGIVTESSPDLHSQFVREIFTQSRVNVALFMALDRGQTAAGHHIHQRVILPFFGGPDDRLALSMVVQMCGHPETTAKVIRVPRNNSAAEERDVLQLGLSPANDAQGKPMVGDVQYSGHTTNPIDSGCNLQSNAADNILWQSFTTFSSQQPSATLKAIQRVEFIELEPSTPLCEVLTRVQKEREIALQEKLPPFIVTGRARSPGEEIPCAELETLLDSEECRAITPELREMIGDVAAALAVGGTSAGVVVVHAVGT